MSPDEEERQRLIAEIADHVCGDKAEETEESQECSHPDGPS